MWLKKYLTLGTDRLTWAYVADILIQMNIPKSGRKINKRLTDRQNPFTQGWTPAMHSNSKLPKDLKRNAAKSKKNTTK